MISFDRYVSSRIQDYDSSTRTYGRLDLYVDAATGNDANPGTKDAPFASIVEAERRIPWEVNDPVVVHVAPHTGDGYYPPTFRKRIMRASIDVVADSGGDRDDGLRELVPETACLAGSNHVSLIVTPGLGVDTYRGKTLEMLSGDTKDCRRTIQLNADDSINPAWCLPSSYDIAVAPGDTLRVVEPVTKMYIPPQGETGVFQRWYATHACHPISSPYFMEHREEPGVNFINFRVEGIKNVYVGGMTRFVGCEWAGDTYVICHGTGCLVSAVDTWSPPVRPDGTFLESSGPFDGEQVVAGERVAGVHPRSWAGWGLTSETMVATQNLSLGYLGVLVSPHLWVAEGGHVTMLGGNLWQTGAKCSATESKPTTLKLDGKIALADIKMRVTNTEGGSALQVTGYGSHAVTLETHLVSDTGVGILAENGGKVTITYTTSVVADVGCKARTGGSILLRDGAGSVTTTGNEIEVGNTPAVGVMADVADAGAFVVDTPSDGSVVQRAAG